MTKFIPTLALLLSLSLVAQADEHVNYAELLPSIAPVEPADAVETLKVQAGFRDKVLLP